MLRIKTFLKSLGVGGIASGVDYLSLIALVEGAGLSPSAANLPALIAGAAVQFVGCRQFVFRNKASAALRLQIAGFALVTVLGIALTALLFQGLVSVVGVPYPIARPAAAFVVYCCFSYPAWRRVFSSERSDALR